jgi:HAD superfamily phosphatase (TIGR01668 family)
MRCFEPKFYYKAIYQIDLSALWDIGIRGIIVDLDNTLVPHNDPHVTPRLADWILRVRKMGFELIIVSNNNDSRVKSFGKIAELLFISSANKPLKRGFLKAARQLGLGPDEVAVIGDQIFTDIWGGNRCGMTTVLVDPVLEKEGRLIRLKRILEGRYRRNLKTKNIDKKF